MPDWTKMEIRDLFLALVRINTLLEAMVKQGEGILRLAEEVEELKRKIAKLEVK